MKAVEFAAGPRVCSLLWIGAALGIAIVPLAAWAQGSNDRFRFPENEEIYLRVARISFLSGSVSFCRGDDPGAWQSAAINVPLIAGDRVHVAESGRAELEFQGENLVVLGPRSDLWIVNLNDGITQLAVARGRASILLSRKMDEETFEVDTGNAAATLQQSGEYRVDIGSGKSSVSLFAARRGTAQIASGGGELILAAGHQIRIESTNGPRYAWEPIAALDSWDQWAETRGHRLQGLSSAAYVNSEVVGVADLDQYGRWDRTQDFGNAWTPTNVGPDWQPYRDGHWFWQDPWGWTWISDEPWGWAPYHYGRWASYPTGWFWVPESPLARYVAYSPALVGFLGGGADGTVALGFRHGGFVGWFPLALQDPFYPWWIPRLDVHLTKSTEFHYRNRPFVTVISKETFLSAARVESHRVRDAAILRDSENAPVLRVPLPLVPTTSSLRASDAAAKATRAEHPSAAILRSPITARNTSLLLPPLFRDKVEVIRQNGAAPIPSSVAATIRRDEQSRSTVQPTLVSATRADGKMILMPSDHGTPELRPQPIASATPPPPRSPAPGLPPGVPPGRSRPAGPMPAVRVPSPTARQSAPGAPLPSSRPAGPGPTPTPVPAN